MQYYHLSVPDNDYLKYWNILRNVIFYWSIWITLYNCECFQRIQTNFNHLPITLDNSLK